MEHDTIHAIEDFMCSDEFVMQDIDGDKTDDFLSHHGIFGMHWGVRRFQSKDGTWTQEGLARRRSGISGAVKKVGETAKKANDTISTAARKTFNPTVADMDEKIAKAKEKEKIAYKKQELKRIQRKNKDIKYMSDQEVQNEIQSRKQRRYLEQMRKQDSTAEKGKKFAINAAKAMSTPAVAFMDIVGDTANYGLRKSGEALVDHIVDSAKWKADKEYKRKYNKEHESEADKLRKKREKEEAKAAIDELKSVNSLRKSRTELEEAKLKRELREEQYQRYVLDGTDAKSKVAADRLTSLKKSRSNGNSRHDFNANFNIGSMAKGSGGNDNNNNNNNNDNNNNKKNKKNNRRNNNQNHGNNRNNHRP